MYVGTVVAPLAYGITVPDCTIFSNASEADNPDIYSTLYKAIEGKLAGWPISQTVKHYYKIPDLVNVPYSLPLPAVVTCGARLNSHFFISPCNTLYIPDLYLILGFVCTVQYK